MSQKRTSFVKQLAPAISKEDEGVLFLRLKKAEKELTDLQKQLSSTLLRLLQRNEFIKSLEQQIKALFDDSEKSLSYSASNILDQLHSSFYLHEEWETLEAHFGKEHHDFIRSLRTRSNKLTPTEIRICILIRLNFSIKQIADTLFISIGTVKQHRNHIRRKFSLSPSDILSSYLLTL